MEDRFEAGGIECCVDSTLPDGFEMTGGVAAARVLDELEDPETLGQTAAGVGLGMVA